MHDLSAPYHAETALKRLVILWTKVDICKTTTAWRSTLLLAEDELGIGDSAERSKTSLKLLRGYVIRQAADVEPHGGLADGHCERSQCGQPNSRPMTAGLSAGWRSEFNALRETKRQLGICPHNFVRQVVSELDGSPCCVPGCITCTQFAHRVRNFG